MWLHADSARAQTQRVPGLCSTHESWVKLTRLWLKWVESESSLRVYTWTADSGARSCPAGSPHLNFSILMLLMSNFSTGCEPDAFEPTLCYIASINNHQEQSLVGRENPGYESSQSRITLIVIWVRVESTGYCLSQNWVTDFLKRKRQDLAIICNYTEKEPTYSYIQPHPPPPPRSATFPKLGKMWWVMSQIWLNSDSNELSQVRNLGFELSRSWVTWIVIWVRVESVRKNESSTTLARTDSRLC